MYVENKNVTADPAGEGVVRKVLSYSPNIMAVELHFEKGAIGAKHSHPHEQIGYIISAGDTYYVAPNVVHGVKTLEETMLLDMFTPMREDFIHK